MYVKISIRVRKLEELKEKILFICLDEKLGESVSKEFADNLSMHFANCRELIEYDLFNSQAVFSQCGEEYYLMRERKVAKMACGYENSVMFATYDIYHHSKEIFDKFATKIYIKIPEKQLSNEYTISKLNYTERDEELKASANFVVEVKRANTKLILKEIYKILGGIK